MQGPPLSNVEYHCCLPSPSKTNFQPNICSNLPVESWETVRLCSYAGGLGLGERHDVSEIDDSETEAKDRCVDIGGNFSLPMKSAPHKKLRLGFGSISVRPEAFMHLPRDELYGQARLGGFQ